MKTRIENKKWRSARVRRRAPATLRLLFSTLVSLLSLDGCTPAGALAYKLAGPRPIPAQYKPTKEPMLVLVENYHNPSAARLDAYQLSNRLADELRFYRVAPVVDPSTLETVQSDPAYAKMTIPAIGRAVGAGQILYVHVKRFAVEETVAGEMIKGTAEMTVRVVDARTGATRWPIDASGHPVLIAMPWQRQVDGATDVGLRDQMSRSAATYIVKLFRKYSAEDRGES